MKIRHLFIVGILAVGLDARAASVFLDGVEQAAPSGMTVLTNGQVLATNIANDSIGPAQTVSQMSYVTNAASFSATIGAASGRWFKIGSWNINSPTAERTFFAQYAEGSGNTPARIMLKTGGAGVAQAGRSVAVMYAESSATNGFGGVGSDSSGNVYVQVTNLSHSAIQISLQASGWCDGFPDSGPSFGTITTNPISDIAASTIVYLPITGNSLIAPHGGVFDYLTVGGSNVQTLAGSGGDLTALSNGVINVGLTATNAAAGVVQVGIVASNALSRNGGTVTGAVSTTITNFNAQDFITEQYLNNELSLFAGLVAWGSDVAAAAPYSAFKQFQGAPVGAWTNSFTLTNGVEQVVGSRIFTNLITTIAAGAYIHHVNMQYVVTNPTAGSVAYRSSLILYDGATTQVLVSGSSASAGKSIEELDSSAYLQSNVTCTASQRLGVIRYATFTRTAGSGNAGLNIFGGTGHPQSPVTRNTRLEGPSISSVVGITSVTTSNAPAGVATISGNTLIIGTNDATGAGGGGGATDVVYAVRTAGEYYAYNTIVTQTFPTALRNDGATWNTNTHRWTPSGTGIAHVQVATYLTNNASGGRITLFHYVNGVLTYAYSDGALPAINDLKHVGSHAFVVTNANDVHSFTFYNNGGMGAYNGAPELNNITIWRVP